MVLHLYYLPCLSSSNDNLTSSEVSDHHMLEMT